MGEKGKIQPLVWRELQRKAHLAFRLLETRDHLLVDVTERLFTETRTAVDHRLANAGRQPRPTKA